MKTTNEILEKIGETQVELLKLEKIHYDMDQISMLSGEGSRAREQINKLKGQIEACIWFLKP